MRRILAISLLIFSVLASATVASMIQTWSAKNTMTVVEAAIFDTGHPSNPYPSIFGVYEGEIKPNKTIEVSKLYTYPCAGTGGHTEYAAFYYSNGTLIAEGHWKGYKEDWHNITFKPFVLLPGETYNCIIRTGSYPQIHHTDALPTANGWINCTYLYSSLQTKLIDEQFFEFIVDIFSL